MFHPWEFALGLVLGLPLGLALDRLVIRPAVLLWIRIARHRGP